MKKLLLSGIAAVCCITVFILSCNKNNATRSRNEAKLRLVPESVARSVAAAFNPQNYYHTGGPTDHSPVKSSLKGNNAIDNEITINDSFGKPAIYVYNFSGKNGFLFVSADSNLAPVLAFIEHGTFKKDTVPGGLIQWATQIMSDIHSVRSGLYDNSKTANAAWKKYWQINSSPEAESRRNTVVQGRVVPAVVPPDDPCANPTTFTQIGPLLPVTWGQGCTYNDLCPNLTCGMYCNNNAWTGCVATAMSQIMRYWNKANSWNYNYASMTTNIGNAEVQRMMRDAGTTVYMNYGCSESGAQMTAIPGALHDAFGFSTATYSGYGYSDVESDLYAYEPVILGGCNGQSTHLIFWNSYTDCHAWVCDGLMDEQYILCDNGQPIGGGELLNFHMNWGWHEQFAANDFNGWFQFNNWNIPGAAANGGAMNFQYNTTMVKHIHP